MARRLFAVAIVVLCTSTGALAQGCKEAGWREGSSDPIAQGGRLYDNWWVTCGLPEPQGTHPAYPPSAKQTGAATWRCKECHGWDYKGKDGAYGSGSHFTGITGITRYATRDEAEIVAILKDGAHRFDRVMDEATLNKIARFVSRGQADAAARIDAGAKKVSGSVRAGGALFEQHCAACHGARGQALNFSGDPDKPEFVGTVASDNPWEALHKIRNGQPGAVMDRRRLDALAAAPDGSPGMPHGGRMHMHMIGGRAMPPMRERLSLAQQLDLLSYLQTLPAR